MEAQIYFECLQYNEIERNLVIQTLATHMWFFSLKTLTTDSLYCSLNSTTNGSRIGLETSKLRAFSYFRFLLIHDSRLVELVSKWQNLCFLALNWILSWSKLGSWSWTIKYTFNTLKTHQKTINGLHLIMVCQPKTMDSTSAF